MKFEYWFWRNLFEVDIIVYFCVAFKVFLGTFLFNFRGKIDVY